MVNWMQAWWQLHQSWSFLRHAYRYGLNQHADVVNAWSQRSYAIAYAVAQVTPPTIFMQTRYR